MIASASRSRSWSWRQALYLSRIAALFWGSCFRIASAAVAASPYCPALSAALDMPTADAISVGLSARASLNLAMAPTLSPAFARATPSLCSFLASSAERPMVSRSLSASAALSSFPKFL